MFGQGARVGDTERVPTLEGGGGPALGTRLGVPGGLQQAHSRSGCYFRCSVQPETGWVAPLASGPSGMGRYSRRRDSK